MPQEKELPGNFSLARRAVRLQARQPSRWLDIVTRRMETLKQEIKNIMVEDLMLQIGAQEIDDHQALFGPGSLGLDSIDALQMVVALDKKYGLKIPDPSAAREILRNVTTIAEAVERQLQSSPGANAGGSDAPCVASRCVDSADERGNQVIREQAHLPEEDGNCSLRAVAPMIAEFGTASILFGTGRWYRV